MKKEDVTQLSLEELAQISGGGGHTYGMGRKPFRPWYKRPFKPSEKPYRPNYPRPAKTAN